MVFAFAGGADNGYPAFALRQQVVDGFRLVVCFLFGNAVKQMPVLLAVLLADGVTVTYNEVRYMPLSDIFVRTAVTTDYIRRTR